MAVSKIEEKILGRLARQAAPSSPLLSASLFQVLGLSILLSRKLFKARKLRTLDISKDAKSVRLYHHIIWLAREGLSITEVYILPYCQDGEQGPECRVMAAKLRASFYHVFCLFHNHPPIGDIVTESPDSTSSRSSARTGKSQARSPSKASKNGRAQTSGKLQAGRSTFRDPIPSMTSETSYITNPFAGPAQTPPPSGPPPPIPLDLGRRRTPSRPPGLATIDIPSPRAIAAFLLPPLNFVPMAQDHFATAQQLATSLLSPAHALRLSVALEYTAFIWDCEKEHERARKLARQAIKEVYASTDGLDDDEFDDASVLVRALAALVQRPDGRSDSRNSNSLRRSSSENLTPSPNQRMRERPHIDRTIAVSPAGARNQPPGPTSTVPVLTSAFHRRHTPERLSTVPEVESVESETVLPPSRSTQASAGLPISRLSHRSRHESTHRRANSSSTISEAGMEKARKRSIAEQAEALYYRRQSTSSAGTGGRASNNLSRTSDKSARSRNGGGNSSHDKDVTRVESNNDERTSSSDQRTRRNSAQSSPRATPPVGPSTAATTANSSTSTGSPHQQRRRRKKGSSSSRNGSSTSLSPTKSETAASKKTRTPSPRRHRQQLPAQSRSQSKLKQPTRADPVAPAAEVSASKAVPSSSTSQPQPRPTKPTGASTATPKTTREVPSRIPAPSPAATVTGTTTATSSFTAGRARSAGVTALATNTTTQSRRGQPQQQQQQQQQQRRAPQPPPRTTSRTTTAAAAADRTNRTTMRGGGEGGGSTTAEERAIVAQDRREAILRTLDIISAVSRGLSGPDERRNSRSSSHRSHQRRSWRLF